MATGDIKVVQENAGGTYDEIALIASEISGTDHLLYDNVEEEYTKTQNFNATSATHSSTSDYEWVLGSNQVHILTAEEDFTITISGAAEKTTYILHFIQDATGGRAVSWSSDFVNAPTLETGANDETVCFFVYSNGKMRQGGAQQ